MDEEQSYFRSVSGVELSEPAADRAADFATEIYRCGVEHLPTDKRFDLIIATHVIEHIYRPGPFVATLVSHLKPGGALVLATPDMGSLWRKVMRRRWPSFKIPEHVLYFNFSTLRRLMIEGGLSEIGRVPYPHAFPLPLVAEKLRIPLPRVTDRFNVWLPGTTVAAVGKLT